MDIKQIPTAELITDLKETELDIKVCEGAQKMGIESYSGGTVLERLRANFQIRQIITTELQRRDAADSGLT